MLPNIAAISDNHRIFSDDIAALGDHVVSKLPVRDSRRPLSPRTEAALEVAKVVLPFLISAGTAFWIAFQYFDAKEKERQNYLDAKAKDRQQLEREISARISEARKPFNEVQLKTYREIANVAGILATATQGDSTYTDAKREFYKHYWSLLSMVEDGKVEAAMVNLERALRNHAASGGRQQDVRVRVYCLATALKSSIERSWTISLPDTASLPKIEDSNRKNCENEEKLLAGANKSDPN